MAELPVSEGVALTVSVSVAAPSCTQGIADDCRAAPETPSTVPPVSTVASQPCRHCSRHTASGGVAQVGVAAAAQRGSAHYGSGARH